MIETMGYVGDFIWGVATGMVLMRRLMMRDVQKATDNVVEKYES